MHSNGNISHLCMHNAHVCGQNGSFTQIWGVHAYMHGMLRACWEAGVRSTDGGSRVLGEAAVVLSGKSNAVSAYVCSIRVQ